MEKRNSKNNNGRGLTSGPCCAHYPDGGRAVEDSGAVLAGNGDTHALALGWEAE